MKPRVGRGGVRVASASVPAALLPLYVGRGGFN